MPPWATSATSQQDWQSGWGSTWQPQLTDMPSGRHTRAPEPSVPVGISGQASSGCSSTSYITSSKLNMARRAAVMPN